MNLKVLTLHTFIKLKMKNFLKSTVRFKLLTFIVLCMSTLSTHAQYFEIESILVDACQSNTTAEALN